ncbi:MAG: GNAT family N-acetyltransferase [Pseudomonadota bacterium]
MSNSEPPLVRSLVPSDDPARLTRLIHAAYAPHAARGLRYWGTHQSVEETAKCLSSGQAFVAVAEGEYVGTITVRPPQPESAVAIYRKADTWSISQFAVAPAFKGRGLGKALHEAAVNHARLNGASTIALDTAAPAQGLIAMYKAWGYELVGECNWRPHTNYMSVLMSRSFVTTER